MHQAGFSEHAVERYRVAASRTASAPEQLYLTTLAARLTAKLDAAGAAVAARDAGGTDGQRGR